MAWLVGYCLAMTDSSSPKIAVLPGCWRHEMICSAVTEAGAELCDVSEADGLIWTDQSRAGELEAHLHESLRWVQLPYAGIEPYLEVIRADETDRVWTCGKGVYARPVAEMALAMILAGLRNLNAYAKADSWSGPKGLNLDGANIVVLGGGGITVELAKMLAAFDVNLTVLRRSNTAFEGADRTLQINALHSVLPECDVLVLALALTPETAGIISAAELALLQPHAVVVNVARGGHIDTNALHTALVRGEIGACCLDVTDPEPLPPEHPLWANENCLITPHVGNTPEMGVKLLAKRVQKNVELFLEGQELIGQVDAQAGY